MNWNGPSRSRGPQTPFEDYVQQLLNSPRFIPILMLGLLVIGGAYSSVYTVQPAERAVVLQLGRFDRIESPGLQFKLPFGIEQAHIVETEQIRQEAFGLVLPESRNRRTQMSSPFGNTGGAFSLQQRRARTRNLDEESLMLTGDLNVADVEWVVQYKVSDPKDFLFQVADPEKNIRDIAQAAMRQVVGDKSINAVLTTGRSTIQIESQALLQDILDDYQMGVEITAVNLQNVRPPERVVPAFNEVNSAEQEKEQDINRAEAERNTIIPEARGKALQEISKAEGYAFSVERRAEGDADRFSALLKEYTEAPVITRERLYLELAEDVLKRVRSMTIIDPSVKGVLPVFMNEKGSNMFGGGSDSDVRAQFEAFESATEFESAKGESK